MASQSGTGPEAACHGGAFWETLGEDFSSLDRRADVITADVLDAWFPPAPAVVQAFGSQLDWLCRTSPPVHALGLQRKIAEVRRIPEASIVLGGGSSALIFLAFPLWLRPSSRALILDPTYGEYAHVLESIVGCSVSRFSLGRDRGFAIDVADLAGRLQGGKFDLVVLVNPNSPTGRALPREAMLRLFAAVPNETRVWVDETYIDYFGSEQSVEAFAGASPNVVVCKSMSKVYALSGLRAAYLCGPAPIIAELRRFTPPWAVSLPAQMAGMAALSEPAYYAARYAETHRLRRRLKSELLGIGFDEVVDGEANFLLAFLPGRITSAGFCEECRRAALFVRDASWMGRDLGDHAVRFAVKDAATNAEMLNIVERVFRG